ncbi:hypothetical protein [Kribbella deserti]|uniref:Uncharacterized protein n=1 Tax=Kribbella deserti TaxID=1926257 RepID=A0ABV6QDU0_9ACTN
MTIPQAPVELTLTTGGAAHSTRVRFTGSAESVRADLTAFFRLEEVSAKRASLHELAHSAIGTLSATSAAGAVLEASIEPEDTSETRSHTAEPDRKLSGYSGGEAPEESALSPLLAQIAAAHDVAELRRLWAGNQAAFADAELMAAWKARGKALTTAQPEPPPY